MVSTGPSDNHNRKAMLPTIASILCNIRHILAKQHSLKSVYDR